MNRKGFTLIELLGVIIVLAIVLAIAVPSISNAYKNSKLKSEEIFVERLSDVIDSYVKLNSSTITFNGDGAANKKNDDETTYSVNIYKGTISIQNIINDNLLRETDYANVGNKNKKCEPNAQIEVYRDSDYVYCYKVKKDSLNCLTDEYKSKITGDYVVDTCVWSR